MNTADIRFVRAGVNMAHDFAQSGELVRLGVNDKVFFVSQPIDIHAQNSHAERVESADKRACDFTLSIFIFFSGNKFCDSFLHFTGGFVGKSDSQYLPWRNTVFNQVGCTICNNTGFAGSGSGQNHNRSMNGFYGLALLWIKG